MRFIASRLKVNHICNLREVLYILDYLVKILGALLCVPHMSLINGYYALHGFIAKRHLPV